MWASGGRFAFFCWGVVPSLENDLLAWRRLRSRRRADQREKVREGDSATAAAPQIRIKSEVSVVSQSLLQWCGLRPLALHAKL